MEVLLLDSQSETKEIQQLSDSKQCRICLDETGNDFIVPCKCMGSLKYVHRSCLDKWRSIDVSQKRFYKCDICLTDFKFDIFQEKQKLVLLFYYLSVFGHVILDIFIINCIVSGISFFVYFSDNNSKVLSSTFDTNEYVASYIIGWIIFLAFIGLIGFISFQNNDVIICINDGGLPALFCFVFIFFSIGVFVGIYLFIGRTYKFAMKKKSQMKIYFNTKVYCVKDLEQEQIDSL